MFSVNFFCLCESPCATIASKDRFYSGLVSFFIFSPPIHMFLSFKQLWIVVSFFLRLLCHQSVIRQSSFLSSSFGAVITW